MTKKHFKKSHLNKAVMSATFFGRSGFGLVEVLIAMGLTAIIALTIMRLMELQTKSQNTTELKARVSEITNIVRQNLTDLEACNATLTGASHGENIPELRTSENLSNPPLVKLGDEYLKSGLLLTSMRLLTRMEEEERGLRSASSLEGVLNSSGIGYSYLEMELTRNEGPKRKHSVRSQLKPSSLLEQSLPI